eukprot:CAMPEP_0202701808 /NCGR_PEP_ID=MMETSP1385-20130828/14861_1 /ASSEMBLY_ACC=CAM_ASM_000861 /TAXON_ID=933848 /ORGANISM="Elphidium margaritaceum" /LENGTH=82 /DNA_ID=CAMNT_0049359303 /DNA_START=96 /DNA_END=344 /DNA_ORIENTATION=-
MTMCICDCLLVICFSSTLVICDLETHRVVVLDARVRDDDGLRSVRIGCHCVVLFLVLSHKETAKTYNQTNDDTAEENENGAD